MPLSTLLENVSGLYAALLSEAEIAVPPLAEIGYTGAAGLDVPKLLACLHRYQPESAILLPQLLLARQRRPWNWLLPPRNFVRTHWKVCGYPSGLIQFMDINC